MKPLDSFTHDEAIDKLLRIANTLRARQEYIIGHTGLTDDFLYWLSNELGVVIPTYDNDFDNQCEMDLVISTLPDYYPKPTVE
jgi:hypothetical protein